MSRYTFTGNAGTTVAIGWDRPLSTFFVQILRRHPTLKGEEETIEWQGTAPGELPNADAAIKIAEPYATLPAELGATLEMDRLKTLGQRDGDAQVAAKQWRFGTDREGER